MLAYQGRTQISSKNGWHLGVLKVSKALHHAIAFGWLQTQNRAEAVV